MFQARRCCRAWLLPPCSSQGAPSVPRSPICQAEMIPPADPGDGGFMLGSAGKAAQGSGRNYEGVSNTQRSFRSGDLFCKMHFEKKKMDSIVR